MKLDNWTLFNLPQADRQLLDHYAAPSGEAAVLKDLPIQVLDLVKPTIRRMESLTGRKCRVIYRGPRPDGHHQSMTRKDDAVRFGVYFR